MAKVVNGQKTFISGGMNADYFTVGVRTGKPGLGLGLQSIYIPEGPGTL